MADWWRSWHGAPTDPKWLLISQRTGVAPGIVSAIAWALLDHASQHEERGFVGDFDAETYAAWSGIDQLQIEAVIQAMHTKGLIVDGRLSAWEKRQPQREDDSTPRVRALRARRTDTQRNETQCNDDETQCNAPEERRGETETDTETEHPTTARARAGEPSAEARETADVLVQAPWVRDEVPAVAVAVERSFALVRDFRPRDGPLVAEKYCRARKYGKSPPDDWYRAWLNFLKIEVRSDGERRAANGATANGHSGSGESPYGPLQVSGDFTRYRPRLKPSGAGA